MKNNPTLPQSLPELSEEDIRAYAYHLYEQSGCLAGHDLDNWLEARACLNANIPANASHNRLHHHIHGTRHGEFHSESSEATILTPLGQPVASMAGSKKK